jgi:hypothetical protein
MLQCDTHVHTPYSYSAFESIDELVRAAKNSGFAVLGINDGTTVEGFREFEACCRINRIYPLFNIEFPVWCDGDHPHSTNHHLSFSGKQCWLHGKALRYPASLNGDSRNLLASIWKTSQDRIWKMIDVINFAFDKKGLPLSLDYATIRSRYSKNSVHNRHLAEALYDLITGYATAPDGAAGLFRELFEDATFNADGTDRHDVLTAICKQLSVGSIFSAINRQSEQPIHFLEAKQVILQTGGIPCFQCSFNDDDEWMKESEGPELLERLLAAKGIHAVEFIPGQTSLHLLRTFMQYLYEHDFCVTMGSGHSALNAASLTPVTSDGKVPDTGMLAMSYRGTCILAAHQEMHAQKRRGFVDESGKRLIPPEKMEPFIAIGDHAIRTATEK